MRKRWLREGPPAQVHTGSEQPARLTLKSMFFPLTHIISLLLSHSQLVYLTYPHLCQKDVTNLIVQEDHEAALVLSHFTDDATETEGGAVPEFALRPTDLPLHPSSPGGTVGVV